MSQSHFAAADVESFAAFGTIMTLLVIGAFAGNIVCYRMTRKLLKSKPSLALVLNLSISDIIVAGVSWGSFMFQHIAAHSGIAIHVIVYKVFWSVLISLGNVTLLTLVGLAGDCFLALRWPLHYKSIATPKCINIYIGVTWACSLMAGAGDFLVAIIKSNYEEDSFTDIIHNSMVFTATDQSVTEVLTASITMLISNLLSFLCLVAMVAMYTYILLKIRKIRVDNTLTKQGGFKSEITAVRTTLMIFTSFLLLWVPTLIINVISVIEPNFLSGLTYIELSIIGNTADTLLMVHSIVDAIIYGLRVWKIIRRHKRHQRGQAMVSRSNTVRKKSSDSGQTNSEFQDDITVETTMSEQRRFSEVSSRGGVCSPLTTISEKVEAPTTNTPPSDDSGINSPHKLSPHNILRGCQHNYIINPADRYMATSVDGDDSVSANSSDEEPPKNIADELITAADQAFTEVGLNETDNNLNINDHSVQDNSSSLPFHAIDSSPHDNHSDKRTVTNDQLTAKPKLTKPLRSSLKNKCQSDKLSTSPDTTESRVRFQFPNKLSKQQYVVTEPTTRAANYIEKHHTRSSATISEKAAKLTVPVKKKIQRLFVKGKLNPNDQIQKPPSEQTTSEHEHSTSDEPKENILPTNASVSVDDSQQTTVTKEEPDSHQL